MNDSLLIKSKFFIRKMKKKNNWFENLNLFVSECIYSDSSRQAVFNHLDLQKSFLKHANYHKQVKYKGKNALACMLLVMDMTFSML